MDDQRQRDAERGPCASRLSLRGKRSSPPDAMECRRHDCYGTKAATSPRRWPARPMRRNHPPTAGCWPGNAPCKNARPPMQSRPGRSGTKAPPTDPQLAPLVTGMSPLQSSAAAPARDQSSRAQRRTPALATGREQQRGVAWADDCFAERAQRVCAGDRLLSSRQHGREQARRRFGSRLLRLP